MRSYWYKFGKPHDWLIHGFTYDLEEALKRREQDTLLFIYSSNDQLLDVLDCADILRDPPGTFCTCPDCRRFHLQRVLKEIQGMIDDVT